VPTFVPGLYQGPPGSCQIPTLNLRRRLSCISQHQQSVGHNSSTRRHVSTTTMGVRLANDVPPRKMYYHPHLHTGYKLDGHTLESVPGSKYLGVHVNKDLSWNDHIQQTSAKASRSVGFLQRNLRGCPQDVKAQAYTTLVRPVLEYASTVWDPYTLQQIYALKR
jgi:hypothetical protein